MICWWSLSVKILSFLRLGPFDMAFLGLRDHFITVSRQFQVVCNQKETININKSRKKVENRSKSSKRTTTNSSPFPSQRPFQATFFFFATPVVGSRGPSLAAEGRRFSSDRGAMAASAGGTGSASGGAPGVEKPGNLWVRWKEEKWTPMGNWAENLKRQNAASGPPSLETPCSVSFQEWHCRRVEKVIGSVSLATINNYHLKKRWTSPIWRKIATGKLGGPSPQMLGYVNPSPAGTWLDCQLCCRSLAPRSHQWHHRCWWSHRCRRGRDRRLVLHFSGPFPAESLENPRGFFEKFCWNLGGCGFSTMMLGEGYQYGTDWLDLDHTKVYAYGITAASSTTSPCSRRLTVREILDCLKSQFFYYLLPGTPFFTGTSANWFSPQTLVAPTPSDPSLLLLHLFVVHLICWIHATPQTLCMQGMLHCTWHAIHDPICPCPMGI